MGMQLKSMKVNKISNEVRNLYESAFEAKDKIPETNLIRAMNNGATLREYYDDDKFVGFTYDYPVGDIVYVGYLATSPSMRGKGYGKQILDAFRSYYKGKRIFLLVESLDPTAKNNEIRNRRQKFYLRNGCTKPGFIAKSEGFWFDCMFMQGSMTKKEVDETLTKFENSHNGVAA